MVKGVWKKFLCCGKPSADEGTSASVVGGQTQTQTQTETVVASPVQQQPVADGAVWWSQNLGQHVNGEFSVAMLQGNVVLEDQCHLESGSLSLGDKGPFGTFVGVFDGHAGPETARFLNGKLFDHIRRYTSEREEMSADIIRSAFLATEEEFIALVESEWMSNPKMASVGSCCLAGIICNGVLYVANAGDSRAVLGKVEEKSSNALRAVRLSEEHNANLESVREELRASHPNDPNIVVLKRNVWRVRGLIQISRSIGDAYLKRFEFNKEPLLPKYIQSESFSEPILKAEPAIQVQRLTAVDQFLIFASDGLWEHLSDQEAVDIVRSSPRDGIARRLVRAALVVAAKKVNMRYEELENVERESRRLIHDDITVIVLFLNCHPPGESSSSSSSGPVTLSVKSPFTF